MPWFAYATKVATLGMINFETGKLIIKDPLTGMGNMLKSAKDKLVNDFDDGVWLGKRPFNNIGISSYAI
jgi:hypothetical protein